MSRALSLDDVLETNVWARGTATIPLYSEDDFRILLTYSWHLQSSQHAVARLMYPQTCAASSGNGPGHLPSCWSAASIGAIHLYFHLRLTGEQHFCTIDATNHHSHAIIEPATPPFQCRAAIVAEETGHVISGFDIESERLQIALQHSHSLDWSQDIVRVG